jgi:hypothetical protein
LHHIVVDGMHASDLGAFCDALGSLFWLELCHKPWRRTQAVGLASLSRELETFYKNDFPKASRMTPLTAARITPKDCTYPFLKSKAAPVRHAAEYAVSLAVKHAVGSATRKPFTFSATHRLHGKETQHRDLIASLFRAMERYVRCLREDVFDQNTCRDSMYTFLRSMSGLNLLWRHGLSADLAKRQPFHIRPKCHMLQHLVQDCVPLFGSPSKFWCYRDEDYVGAIKRICAKTKAPATLESRVLLKVRIIEGLSLEL